MLLHPTGPGSLLQHLAATQQPAPAAMTATSRPGTSASLSKSIIQGALQQRRQQRAEQFLLPAQGRNSSTSGSGEGSASSRPVSGGGGSTSRSTSSGGGGITRRSSTGAAAAATGTRPGTAAGGAVVEPLVLPPAPGDAAAAAVAAQQEALLAQWDTGARRGLAACAEQAVSGQCSVAVARPFSHASREAACRPRPLAAAAVPHFTYMYSAPNRMYLPTPTGSVTSHMD